MKKRAEKQKGVVKKSVSLPAELCQQAEAKADRLGESFSHYVRIAVRKDLGMKAEAA
jgi:Arc/MetJ-type ribon-helix-helix transcriptional regulator